VPVWTCGVALIIVAKMVLNDFLRGKLPWYTPDPSWPERKAGEQDEEFEGRGGRLGEKRKRNEGENEEETISDEEGIQDVDSEEAESADPESEAAGPDEGSDAEGEAGIDPSDDDRMQDTRPPKKARHV
jgi:nuclear GTP-binding protein